jgi:uncharacterized membrane protein YfcA
MPPLDALIVVAVGFLAGVFNSVVGFGTSITFPALVLLGYSPLVANTSNKVGLLPGILSGIFGYRRELIGHRKDILVVIVVGIIGGLGGGLLLVGLPAKTFTAVAPIIIIASTVLFIFQPYLSRRAKAARAADAEPRSGWKPRSVLLVGALYGGYFGAGQGVIYIASLAMVVKSGLQHVIALKNVMGAVVTGTSSILFLAIAPVSFWVALYLAAGSIGGGYLGAVVGRKLPITVLRLVVIAVSLVAAAVMLV